MGHTGADPGGDNYAGESYVVFGKSGGFGSALDLSTLDGTTGFRLDGIEVGDHSGRSVSSAGDVNGDGFDDLIIGARAATPGANILAGESYVVFGKSGGFGSAVDLSTLDGMTGFRLDGIDTIDHSGRSVSNAGDVNGDGFDDLIIGAYLADAGASDTSEGESYVVFGGNFTGGAETQVGDATANTLTAAQGAGAIDILIGGLNDDTLISDGGEDVLYGGEGNDTLAIVSTGFQRVAGGSGSDTLSLVGTGITLDLTTIADNTVTDIEVIDISGSGSNTLTLDFQEVVNLSSHSNMVRVLADADDAVNIGNGWTFTGFESVDGRAFAVHTQGAATLQIAGQVSLDSLGGSTGFRLDGIDADDRSGYAVSSAGDVNGDGFDDLIIGANLPSAGLTPVAGASFVVFGKSGGFGSTVELSSLDGTTGFRVDGFDVDGSFGVAVSSAGDVNGDGFDDLIIGVQNAYGRSVYGSYTGMSFVIFGKSGAFSSAIDLSTLDGTTGFRLDGVDPYDNSGVSVSSAGDVNGDGFDDLIIGANQADPGGRSSAGESYVVFGKSGGFSSAIDLATLDGTTGFRLDGVDAGDQSGRSVSSAGDVNGDGFGDLIIGAELPSPGAAPGVSFVVFGKSGGFASVLDLNELNGTNGFRLNDSGGDGQFPVSVSSLGDVNGDGFDDVIIGVQNAYVPVGIYGGQSFVVFGKSSGFDSAVDLTTLDGTTGFRLDGGDYAGFSGVSVSNAGDVNGDGFDDILIGAHFADSNGNGYVGESYVVFGKSSAFASAVDLGTLNGTIGFRLDGIDADDRSGSSVSSAGDVNGDGFDDLIIGAYLADAGASDTREGESYVVFGGNFTGGAETQVGDATGNTLTATLGGGAIDILIGGGGNDVLISDGGADVLRGGEGDDTLAMPDADFSSTRRLLGGNGFDTLRLDGSSITLDLTTIADNRIVDVELIDITGSGNNTLTLDLQEVLNVSSHSNTLLVQADARDTVNIGSGWTAAGQQTFTNTGLYDVFTQGAATLGILDVAPVVTIDFQQSTVTDSSNTSEVTIEFSEDVTGFTSTDLNASGGTLSDFTIVDSNSFTVNFTANDGIAANGTVSLAADSYSDLTGNLGAGGSDDVSIDTQNPTVAVNIASASLTDSGNSSLVTFAFSEDVTGFDGSDVTASGGILSNFTTLSDSTYAALLTASDGIEATGSVTVGTGYTDTSGNTGTGGSDTVMIDTLNPTVTVNIVDTALNDADNSSTVTFTFSEATTSFEEGDVTATNGTLSSFSGSGTSYTATFTADDDFVGSGTVMVAVGGYSDAAANSGAAGSDTVAIDTQNSKEIALPDGGGSYEVLRNGADLVVQIAAGAELFRLNASTVSQLTVTGSASADNVTVLNSGTAVTTALVLSGGAGNDRLDASAAGGSVVLNGDAGNDTLLDSPQADVLNGGADADTLIATVGPSQDLTLSDTQLVNGTTDTVTSVEQAMLNGDAAANLITAVGFNGATTILAGAGNDTVFGAKGDDSIEGGDGADFINGLDGNDTGLGQGGADTVFGGNGLDSLVGGDDDDLVDGQSDNDIVLGGPGDDLLFGREGDDFLESEGGDDDFFGGPGNDVINGGGDNDRLFGEAGNDTLDGESGDDVLVGGEGNDSIVGGTGIDTLQIAGNADLELTASTASGEGDDVHLGIEQAVLNGGAGNNQLNASTAGIQTTLNGGGGNDTLSGSSMDDQLNGGDGSDLIDGQQGDDNIAGGPGIDTLQITGGTRIKVTATTTSGAGNDVYVEIEQAILEGGDANNRLDASTAGIPVTLNGGAGSDTLLGSTLDDVLNGGDGTDFVQITGNDIVLTNDFALISVGNDVSLAEGLLLIASESGSTIDASAYTLGPVTIIGSNGDDTLTGTSGDDVILAGVGDDQIDGGDGNDILRGHSGDDTINGEAGDDTISGGAGRDQLDGGVGADLLRGGRGADTLRGGDGDDLVLGDGGNDLIDGDDGVDTLFGNGGSDNIAGGLGVDRLNGVIRDDSFNQQVGRDTLIGGIRPSERPAPVSILNVDDSSSAQVPLLQSAPDVRSDDASADSRVAEELTEGIDEAFQDALLPALLDL